MARRGAHRELNDWLDHHGYRHAHAAKPKTAHPYAVSSRMAHATRAQGEPKFTVGDIVKRTAARMRSMGLVSGPVNGMVVGYSGKWPLIRWSNMADTDEPMAQAEEGLELDKRAMAKRGSHHATRKTTVTATKAAIRATGASVKYQDGEWQVNVPRGTEATAYYTNDADDAIATARSMMERAGASHGHARKKGDRLFIGTFPTGIRYADRHRERGGDYLPIAFLPYSSLQLEWEPGVPVALELREQIERHANSIRARRGEAYPISSSGQTVKLGHARMVESPTGRDVFASKERNHHITTHGRQTLGADQFALPPGPEEIRRGIKGRLPIDTVKRARNALARAAQMKKRGHLTAAQLATVKRKVHAAWPSIGT